MSANETLIQNIEDWKKVEEVQNQTNIAKYGDRAGLITIEVSVAALMAQLGVTALPVGTYTIKVPSEPANANNNTWDTFAIPNNSIYEKIVVDTHEAKAGSGTITPKLGATALTAIATIGVKDDTAKVTALTKLTADAEFTIVVASNTVTAGAFTIFIHYLLGN